MAAWHFASIRFISHTTFHLLGDFSELARLVPEVLRDAQDRGDQYTVTGVRNRLLPFVYLAADEPEKARRELDEAIGDWSMRGFHLQHYFHAYALGEVDLYAGNPRAAWDWMLGVWGRARSVFLLRFQVVAVESRHFQARAAISLAAQGTGVRENLRAAARQARAIERYRSLWGSGLALLIRAGVASVRGKWEIAADLLARAEKSLGTAGMQHYLAAARWNQGTFLGDSSSTALRQSAERYYKDHNVRNPERMTAAFVPGRWRRPGFPHDPQAGEPVQDR